MPPGDFNVSRSENLNKTIVFDGFDRTRSSSARPPTRERRLRNESCRIYYYIFISRYCVVARISRVNDVRASYSYYIIHVVKSVGEGRKRREKWKEGGGKY